MNTIQALLLLLKIISDDSTHKNYKRVTDLADKYYAYVTGDGLDEELRQFAKRESEEDFDQRVLITKHIIPSVVSNLTAPERKVPRSNGMVRTLTYGEDEKDQAKDLEQILSKFWGDKSFDNWMATRWLELNDIDPNAFVVFEWERF